MSKKTLAIFDVEADDLCATKIHCLCYESLVDGLWTAGTITDYDEIAEFFEEFDIYVGHNIIRYDLPVVKKFTGADLHFSKAYDTFGLSLWLYPKEVLHGLESWGERFGIPKPKITDWKNLPIEEYIHRCQEDVRITKKLYQKQARLLTEIYADNLEDIKRMLWYTSYKLYCVYLQERHKVKLDKELCESILDKMLYLIEEKVEALKLVMPKVEVKKFHNPPKNPKKKDGTLSVAGVKWQERLQEFNLPEDHDRPVEFIHSYKEPNPNSGMQVKDWLTSLGWIPRTFKHVPEDDGSKRAIPQVRDGSELCESVKELIETTEEVRLLEGLTVLNHRASILKGFLRDQVDGFLEASMSGFTNTMRLKHKTLVNLPGVTGTHKPEEGVEDYADGVLIRGCLIARRGQEFCGADVTSLEDTTKQHFMHPFDPEYVEEMQKPGFDPHLDIAKLAGFLTEEQVQAHKDGTADYGKLRKRGKVVNFSAVYGVGYKTLSRSSGLPEADCRHLLDVYWNRNWAVKRVAETQKWKTVRGQMWLFNPVSRFWYSLRQEKDIFSTLNQGTGVYCFDMWVKHILEQREQLSMQFHDETVTELVKGHREANTRIMERAMELTNEELKLNTTLSVDIKYGKNYAEVH